MVAYGKDWEFIVAGDKYFFDEPSTRNWARALYESALVVRQDNLQLTPMLRVCSIYRPGLPLYPSREAPL
jgi:hypothetical protein